jgi:hypothetical protein
VALAELGDALPGLGVCPCGEQAIPGQNWTTTWYDRHGLVERFVVTQLCSKHKARTAGRGWPGAI